MFLRRTTSLANVLEGHGLIGDEANSSLGTSAGSLCSIHVEALVRGLHD